MTKPTDYFKRSNKAFEAVVRLDGTEPGDYDPDEIQADIKQYARVSSLGEIHRNALDEIKTNFARYAGDPEGYPEAKCYGIVGQYGDGKTHFLTRISDLLQQESDVVYPDNLNLLALDPFNFPRNPAAIVDALRERVKVELGPDAAGNIPEAKRSRKDEIRRELEERGTTTKDVENLLEGVEIMAVEGENAGKAFAEGCLQTVNQYEYDGIVLLMDEIEKISRESTIQYKELDRYREFFDQIGSGIPVYFIVTAPNDQWNHFENIHSGAMDRMFGPAPRNHVRLRTLNEDELAETWTLRRDTYLRTEKQLPPEYNDDRFPLHGSTLRAISAIAQRAVSNRTAIDLMEGAFEQTLTADELQWVPPAPIFELSEKMSTGSGEIFNPEQHANITERSTDRVLTSIAATLESGITFAELLEVLELPQDRLKQRLENLEQNGWIIALSEGDTDLTTYRLEQEVLRQLEPDADVETGGDIAVRVKTIMARTDQSQNLIERNLLQIFSEKQAFANGMKTLSEEDRYLVTSGNYGDYHNRNLLVTTGDYDAEILERFRQEANEDHENRVELVLTVNHSGYNFDDADRIIGFTPDSWQKELEYEIEGLEYPLGMWLSAYTELQGELETGGQRLLNTIENHVYNAVIGLNEFELSDRIRNQFERIYPKYPGPVDRMNTSALDAYKDVLSRGKVTGTLTWKELADNYPYADTENSIKGYFQDWQDYDLADVDFAASQIQATIKLSQSGQLILDHLDEDETTPTSDIVAALEQEGYQPKDVQTFIELLKSRNRIRETETGELFLTTGNLILARKYYDLVKQVAKWLTYDGYSDRFKRQYVSNRDAIVGQLQICNNQFDRLGSEEFDSESTNIVDSFIENTSDLRDECVQALQDFENTDVAHRIYECEQQIEALKETGPEDFTVPDEYHTLVSELRTIATSYANSAQAEFEMQLATDAADIFQNLETFHTDFAETFAEVGPYDQYSSEEKIEEIQDTFEKVRPPAKDLADAISSIETFESRLDRAEDVVQISQNVADGLDDIAQFEVERYEADEQIALTDQATRVLDKYDQAAEKYENLATEIQQLRFKQLESITVQQLRSDQTAARSALDNAKQEQVDVDEQIESRVTEIHTTTTEYEESLSAISETHEGAMRSMFPPQDSDSEIVSQAEQWWKEFTSDVEELASQATEIKQQYPNNISGLAQLEEAKQAFDAQVDTIRDSRDRLAAIQQKYFEEVREELPPADAETIEQELRQDNSGEVAAEIKTILERIDRINELRDIDLPPIRTRIIEHIQGASDPVALGSLAHSIPDPAFKETPQQVLREISKLIQEGELILEYEGEVTVRQQ